MAGGRLEVFKFGLYLLLPGALIVHLKKPEWYTNHVDPYRQRLFPPKEMTNSKLPVDQTALREELARIKAEKLARRLEREQAEQRS